MTQRSEPLAVLGVDDPVRRRHYLRLLGQRATAADLGDKLPRVEWRLAWAILNQSSPTPAHSLRRCVLHLFCASIGGGHPYPMCGFGHNTALLDLLCNETSAEMPRGAGAHFARTERDQGVAARMLAFHQKLLDGSRVCAA